jgi:hypothetical protein
MVTRSIKLASENTAGPIGKGGLNELTVIQGESGCMEEVTLYMHFSIEQ